METLNLDAVEIPPDVLSMVPADTAQRYHMIPLRFEKETETLVVAMADPDDLGALEDLHFRHDCELKVVAADRAAVDAAIRRCYGSEVDQMIDGWIAVCQSYRPFSLKALADKVHRVYHELLGRLWGLLPFRHAWIGVQNHQMGALFASEPFVMLTNLLIMLADGTASSIVVECSEGGGKISFEIEGELREIRSFSPKVARQVMGRLRRMAGMGYRADEGLITVVFERPDKTVHYRVRSEPGAAGERLHLRLIDMGEMDGPEQPG